MVDQQRAMSAAMSADAYRKPPPIRDDPSLGEYFGADPAGRYALPYDPTLERAYLIVDEALPGQKHRPKHAKAPMTLRQVTDLTMERIRRLGRL